MLVKLSVYKSNESTSPIIAIGSVKGPRQIRVSSTGEQGGSFPPNSPTSPQALHPPTHNILI